jgi:hypothetical protein
MAATHPCKCGCGTLVAGRRLCAPGHAKTSARALDASSLSETTVALFWSKTRVDDNWRCLEWVGTKRKNGYGTFRDPDTKRLYGAHRLAHALTFGPLPAGVQVNHRCDVAGLGAGCVNPLHARRGSQVDNMQDAAAAGFLAKKLSASNVLELRYLRNVGGVGRSTLAEKFGISERMVDMILKGSAWLRVFEPGSVPASFWAREAACDRGHEFTPANTLISPNGRRRCRTCKLEWRRVHLGVSSPRTHCHRGHLLDAANTRTDRSGYTVCRACQRDYGRAYLARQKSKVA